MPMCNFQGQIRKCLLLLEIEQDKSDEIHIRHGNGTVLRFTRRDFSIITGLKCTRSVEEFQYTDKNPSRLMRTYFPGAYASVKKGYFVDHFLMGEWESTDDVVQMAILYFIHSFVYSQLSESSILADHFRMVEDGSYVRFPWGQTAYERLIESFIQEFTVGKQLYRFYSMPYAINVWMYECALEVDQDVVVREGTKFPRILNWRIVGERPSFRNLISTMFTENGCSNLTPTENELRALELPAPTCLSETVSLRYDRPRNSNVQTQQGDKDVLTGFEDFSTEPPKHILRRSKRFADSNSPEPLPKKRTDHAKKTMAIETPNTKRPSRHVSIPKEVTKHANPSSNTDQHEGSAKYDEGGDVNEVKHFLKTYVDQKFNILDQKFIALEALIKTNHTKTIRAIENEVHAAEKEMDDQEDPTMAADFGQAVIDDSLDGSVMRPKQPTEAMEDVLHTTGPTEVEAHVPAAEHDVCADGDFHPDRIIQLVLMELSKEVSEPVNPPEVVHVLDVEELTKVD